MHAYEHGHIVICHPNRELTCTASESWAFVSFRYACTPMHSTPLSPATIAIIASLLWLDAARTNAAVTTAVAIMAAGMPQGANFTQ